MKALADKLHQLAARAKVLGNEALAMHKEFTKVLGAKPRPKVIATEK